MVEQRFSFFLLLLHTTAISELLSAGCLPTLLLDQGLCLEPKWQWPFWYSTASPTLFMYPPYWWDSWGIVGVRALQISTKTTKNDQKRSKVTKSDHLLQPLPTHISIHVCQNRKRRESQARATYGGRGRTHRPPRDSRTCPLLVSCGKAGAKGSCLGKKWPGQHEEFRRKHGLANVAGADAWSAQHRLEGLQLERERDLIDLTWSYFWTKHSDIDPVALERDLVVDVSQTVARSPWSLAKIRSLTAVSRFYSFALDKILDPQLEFSMLGFGPVNLQGLTRAQSCELAAQAMSQPVITMLAILAASTLLN